MFNVIDNIYRTYINKKMLSLLSFGFGSGFPFPLVFGTLSLWLKDFNITYALIGYFSLLKIPYSFKWLWSPVIDNIKIPLLNRLGRRRSWILLLNIMLFISIISISLFSPHDDLLMIAIFSFFVSFFSASLDIVLDAFRIECFEEDDDKQASGVAIFVLGYRLGLIFSGAGAIYLASKLSWNIVYLLMSLGCLISFITVFLVKEPIKYRNNEIKNIKCFLKDSVIIPLKDFIKRDNWILILLFILIYRLSDAYFGPMSMVFYDDMGFSKIEIASITKIYGTISTIIGGIVGGIIVSKLGIKKSLYYFGIIQILTTLLFILLAKVGYNTNLLITIITIENFSSGLATTAFVAYISSICNKLYTATQYALLSSMMSLSRDLISSTSGFVLEITNWEIFFIITSLMSIPSLFLIKYCVKDNK